MITSNAETSSIWFVDFGVSNPMTSHEEWFMNLRGPERRGVVETGDDSMHPIEHIGDVPFSKQELYQRRSA